MDPNALKPGSSVPITIKKEITSALPNSKEVKGPPRLGSSSRLPSFKGPRDLTLSALVSANTQTQVTRTKKTFLPNIPVRREKGEKIIESKSERTAKKNFNKSKQGEHVKGRGRGKEKEFVQTKGSLFGEGTAAAPLKRTSDIYRGAGGGRGGGSSKIGEMQKPVLNPDAAYNIDKDLEDKKLKEILRDNFIDDPDDVMAIELLPVHLPMITKNEPSFKSETDSKEKNTLDTKKGALMSDASSKVSGIRVKQEPGLEEDVKQMDDKKNGLIGSLNPAFDQIQESEGNSVADILSKSHSDIMFIQLPSCLPGHPPEIKVEPTSSGDTSQASRDSSTHKEGHGRSESSQPSKPPLCSLESLPEGQIGTMKVYESGCVQLCLGNHTMEISRGTQVGFLQDVVRIEVDSEVKSGSLVVLGHIQERFVCSPDFLNLTKNLKS